MSEQHERAGRKPRRIVTYYDPKPGACNGPDPFRWDWEAHEEDYDEERGPLGYGSTEQRAIDDLITQLTENESEEA